MAIKIYNKLRTKYKNQYARDLNNPDYLYRMFELINKCGSKVNTTKKLYKSLQVQKLCDNHLRRLKILGNKIVNKIIDVIYRIPLQDTIFRFTQARYYEARDKIAKSKGIIKIIKSSMKLVDGELYIRYNHEFSDQVKWVKNDAHGFLEFIIGLSGCWFDEKDINLYLTGPLKLWILDNVELQQLTKEEFDAFELADTMANEYEPVKFKFKKK